MKRRLLVRLPRSTGDVFVQLALFVLAELCYESVRGIVVGRVGEAYANAHAVVGLEKSLGLFFEPSLQSTVLNFRWLIDIANWSYMNSHFTVTSAFLVWLYFARNEHFYFVRNMFMVAMGLALIGYLFVPTAPPRMLSGYGFVDSIAQIGHINSDSSAVKLFINPYAAVPSMHVAFSLMVGIPAALLVRNLLLKFIWALYPPFVLFVVIVTGNHYWFDGLAGAAVAALSALTASYVLSRARPAQWAWQRATA